MQQSFQVAMCTPAMVVCVRKLAAVLAPDTMHARGAGGKLAIVNLQKTPKDRRAALVLRARADRVMAALMAALALQACPKILKSFCNPCL